MCDVENASTCVKVMLFCCKIGVVAIYALLSQICFVVIYAFLCGDKINQKLRMWRTNDKYEVCRDIVGKVCIAAEHCTKDAKKVRFKRRRHYLGGWKFLDLAVEGFNVIGKI